MRITRRLGDSFYIGPNIKVTVDGFKDGRVRLTVVAPETLAVWGEEVLSRLSDAARDALIGQEIDADADREVSPP